MNGCFRISTHYFKHINADCDVDIIISGSKPPVLSKEVFIMKIQYRIILHLQSRAHLLSLPPQSHQRLYQVSIPEKLWRRRWRKPANAKSFLVQANTKRLIISHSSLACISWLLNPILYLIKHLTVLNEYSLLSLNH